MTSSRSVFKTFLNSDTEIEFEIKINEVEKKYTENTVSNYDDCDCDCLCDSYDCVPTFHSPNCILLTLPPSSDPYFMVEFLNRRRHLLGWAQYNNCLPLSKKEMSDNQAKSVLEETLEKVETRDIILNEKENSIMKKVGLSIENLNRLWVISHSKNEFAFRLFLQLLDITTIPENDLNLHENCECNSETCVLMKISLHFVRKVTFNFYPPNLNDFWSVILTQLNNIFEVLKSREMCKFVKNAIWELGLPEKDRNFSSHF